MTRQGIALVTAAPSNDRELGLSAVVLDYIVYIYMRLFCAALGTVYTRCIALCGARHGAPEVYYFVQRSARCTQCVLLCAALSTVHTMCIALCSAQYSAHNVYYFVQCSARCTQCVLLCAASSTVHTMCIALCSAQHSAQEVYCFVQNGTRCRSRGFLACSGISQCTNGKNLGLRRGY